MYRRYSTAGSYVDQGRRPASPMKNVLIILLLVISIVLGVLGLPALKLRGDLKKDYIQVLRTECYDALTVTDKLSRTASASSGAMLARVRSDVHAMQVINDESDLGGFGGKLLSEETLSSLLLQIDSYLDFITTGMDTGDKQTNLSNELSALYDHIQTLD